MEIGCYVLPSLLDKISSVSKVFKCSVGERGRTLMSFVSGRILEGCSCVQLPRLPARDWVFLGREGSERAARTEFGLASA